jgi:hypothetical protein
MMTYEQSDPLPGFPLETGISGMRKPKRINLIHARKDD